MDKKQKEARRRQEDMALNRGLIWVGVAIVLEMMVIFIKRSYLEYGFAEAEVDLAMTMHTVLKGLRIACPLAAVLCLAWALFQMKKGVGKTGLLVSAALVLCQVAVCAHVSVAYKEAGVQMLLLLVPAMAGLALVYYLYQKEFFLAAAASGLSVLGLWFVRYGGAGPDVVLTLVGILLVLAVTLWLKKQGGNVNLLGRSFQVLPKDAAYPVILVTGVVSLAVVAGAMVLGAAVAYYLLFVMVVWLFALLVYYTVKMM